MYTIVDQQLKNYIENLDALTPQQADAMLDQLMDRYDLTTDNTDGFFDQALNEIYAAQVEADKAFQKTISVDATNSTSEVQEFEIEVCRIGYGYRTFTISARSLEEAEAKALDEAGGYSYTEKDSEYKLANEF